MNLSIFPILRPVRKLILLLVIAIFSIILCFAFFIYQSSQYETDNNVIADVYGKQRILTQSISKDANRLYALIQAKETGGKNQTSTDINNQITAAKKSLSQARRDFAATLSTMHNGTLSYGKRNIKIDRSSVEFTQDLDAIDQLWANFDKQIGIILSSSVGNNDLANAVSYVNDKNIELLNYSDSITQAIADNSIQSKKQKDITALGLIFLFFCIVIVSLYKLLRYILLPFDELYKGISKVGLSKVKLKATIPSKRKAEPVVSEVSNLFNKINYLISLIENINRNTSFNETLEFIYNSFSHFIPYTYIGIALFHNDNKVLEASYGVSDGTMVGLLNNLIGKQILLKDTSLEQVIESGEARIINDLELYTAGKPLKEYNRIILEAGVKSSITLPLKVSDNPVGVIFFSSNKKNVYNEEHVRFLKTLVNSIAISFEKNIYVDDLIYSSILALAKLAESRDEDTGDHLDRMKVYSRAIAKYLFENHKYLDEINPEYINDIERFSPMHDIGKVGIRDGILLKQEKLTPDEFEEMKKHTINGSEVLKIAESNMSMRGKNLFRLGIEISECHHEKWDGSGYPRGKKGREIPLSARIVAVADVFDALTSRRPYKEPFSFEKSLSIIENGRGKHFDPNIVDVFVQNKERIEHIYNSFLLS